MSDIIMPEAVITLDGYTLRRVHGGYTDGDWIWTHAQIARAMLTGEVVPW